LESKSALRKHMAAIRDAIPDEERAAKSAAIARRLAEWRRFAQAQAVLAFLSTRSEVLTEGIIGVALALGKMVGVPRTLLEEKRLDFRQVASGGQRLVPGPFGIMEPAPDAPPLAPADADLILVPGLAFDAQGYRLGYGGGFYDRLLGDPGVGAAAVGIAFEEQIVERVPRGEGDRPVGWVVTDKRIVRCGGRRSGRGRT
jgi:5-formyltetrahydrofolate cyclo-ligase